MGMGEDSEDGSIAMDHDLGGCVITRNFEALISLEFFSFRGVDVFRGEHNFQLDFPWWDQLSVSKRRF